MNHTQKNNEYMTVAEDCGIPVHCVLCSADAGFGVLYSA